MEYTLQKLCNGEWKESTKSHKGVFQKLIAATEETITLA